MNRSEFKLRMLSLKSYRELNPGKGYWDWRNSLPDNLKYTNDLEYDMRGAYESGAQPKLEDDGLYHLPSRDSRSGRILKSSTHPTYWKALEYDSKIGYKPYFIGNDTYTWNDEDGPFIPWLEVEAYKDGGTKIGTTRTDYYGNLTYYLPVSLLDDTLDVGLPEIAVTPRNNLNLASAVTEGMNQVGRDLVEASTYVTPLGDVLDAYNVYSAVRDGAYGTAVAGIGLALLPGLIGKVANSLRRKYGKQGLIRSIYNNVAPGSYYSSYIPEGTKRTEIKNALKDYVLGRGDKVDPKWENWFRNKETVGSFLSKLNSDADTERFLDAAVEARKEAWMNYLGIPHEDKYLINTGVIEDGMPVYRSNLTAIPNAQLLALVNVADRPDKMVTWGDYINTTGGNIGVSYKELGPLRRISTYDTWDINPFKDANRARILPSWLRNRYSHIEVLPDGYRKVVWNADAPKWLTDMEPSQILGTPGPFVNRTEFTARRLGKDLISKTKIKTKQDFIDQNVDIESNTWYVETPEEYQMELEQALKRYSKLYDQLLKDNPDKLKETIYIDDKELLKLYGLFVRSYEGGGEIPPDNSPVHVNPITGKPLANGAILPVFDLEDAANFTPAGDALSVRDAYMAASNNDWLNLTLAGLGVLPFVPRFGRGFVPTVNRGYVQLLIELMEKERAKRLQVVDDFYNLQDQVYESIIDNEDAFKRAVKADNTAGTNYVDTYSDLLRSYSKGSSKYNEALPLLKLTNDIPDAVKAQVDPNNLDWIRINRRYTDLNELDPVFLKMNPGLVRHELGHIVDEKSNLDYIKKLGDRSKFESEERLKEMYPSSYKRIQDYLLNGSEIKSHMNEFRDFLFLQGDRTLKKTPRSMRQKLDKYKDLFKNLNILFDSYKSKKQFIKDYNSVPIVQNNQRSNKSNYA